MKSLDLASYDEGIDLTCKQPRNQGTGVGITHLSLRSTDEPDYSIMDANAVLKRYRNKLEHIELKMDLDTNDSAVYTIQYPHLKTLHLDSTAWWIPRNAPMLQELTMTPRTINSNSAVLDTIPPNLEKLVLQMAQDPFIHNKAALVRYLTHLGQQSQLKVLVIDFSSLDNVGSVLDAVCSLHQLQHLRISFTSNLESSQMETFFDNRMQGCPGLSYLDIHCQNVPSPHTLNALKQLEHLEHFRFPSDWMNSDERFRHEMENVL